MIRAGVGLSTEADPIHAGLDAASQARSTLGGERPDWAIVFATREHRAGLDDLLVTLAEALETPYVVGCSASGVLGAGREVETGPGLSVLAVSSDSIRATPFLFHDAGDHGLSAGMRVGQRLAGSRASRDLVLVWPDPYHVRPDRFLQGLDATLAGVPVAGGAASGDGAERDRTFQFSGAEWATDAVSGVRLGGRLRHRVAVTQGCRPLGGPHRVTRSHENLVLEVDGRPPLQVLREVAPAGMLDDPDWALHFLFVGLVPEPEERAVRAGEYLVRNIVAADEDTGVLAIADGVEEGQSLLFALREGTSAETDLRRMTDEIATEPENRTARFALYFDCLARGRSLYRRDGVDAAILAEAFPDIPVAGFFCNAEIAPLRGVNHLFTYTGVLVLVGD